MPSTESIMLMGERRYRVDRDWCRWPAEVEAGRVSQIAVDAAGRVLVLQRGGPPVVMFDGEGGFLGIFGEGEILDPHGISAAADGRILIADRDAHQILVYDGDGRISQRLGRRGEPAFGAPFNHPTKAVAGGDGAIYVSDGYGNACVHRFDADGELTASWGAGGAGPGEFSTPHSVAQLADGRVLVADRENDRVQVFDAAGQTLGQWTGLYHPMDIFVDASSGVFVTDQVPRIHLFGADGAVLGRCRGAINGAHGITGDKAGNLYLAELPPARVTKLERLD